MIRKALIDISGDWIVNGQRRSSDSPFTFTITLVQDGDIVNGTDSMNSKKFKGRFSNGELSFSNEDSNLEGVEKKKYECHVSEVGKISDGVWSNPNTKVQGSFKMRRCGQRETIVTMGSVVNVYYRPGIQIDGFTTIQIKPNDTIRFVLSKVMKKISLINLN
eukprot:TRINITY_DN6622_c0_g1_i1.p1 TRINITY_DN6622_c0_g1~~TRINITY_DN6622_c0_g1_i1.p1  ORF type:complete len:170 (+),score=24.90 TRINITY_DN6622_c0_g1_i1:26-511(+)